VPTYKRIFVTGVNGHIGNHIVRDLLEHGYEVKGSVRSLSDPSRTKHVLQHAVDVGCEERLELVEGDVLDADPWQDLLAGCDVLLHTATVYSIDASAETIIDTAMKGTAHLFNAAKACGIQRIVYTSSVAAVGSMPKGVEKNESFWQENHALPYTKAKTESEKLATELANEFGLDLRIINPSAVIGGGFSRPTPSVAYFDDAFHGRFPLAPKFPMAFVHVKDVAIAHRRAFEVDQAQGRFILAPHHSLDMAHLCKRIRVLYPKSKSPKRALPNFMLPVAVLFDLLNGLRGQNRYLTRQVVKSLRSGDAYYSSKKAEDVLGMEWIDFDTAVRDTVEGFQ